MPDKTDSEECQRRAGSDESYLNEVLFRLKSMADGEVTNIGELPAAIAQTWKGLSTRTVVITAERREHYRLGRRQYLVTGEALEEFERQVILTVRDPDEIYRNASQPFTAIMWRRVSPERHMRVVVALSTSEILSNSVITAWRPSARKYQKARDSGRLVWERV